MAKLFKDSDESTMKAAIRQLFTALGGNVPSRELAIEAIRRGVFTADELERCQLRAVQAICRDALSEDTEDRVPFAQPTGSHRHDPWLQLDLFTYERFCGLIERRAKGVVDDYDKLRRLHAWGLRKFGKVPEIPQLTELDAV